MVSRLGTVLLDLGETERAGACFAEYLEISEALGDRREVALALGGLGNVAGRQGDYAQAVRLKEQSLTIRRELGEEPLIARLLHNLACDRYDMGESEAATADSLEALHL